MAIIPIRKYGDPVLRKKAEPVLEIDERLATLVADMIETMYHAEGAGLAAPQVGESISLIVLNTSFLKDEPGGALAMINPETVKERGEYIQDEGCLSIPEIREDVTRAEEIVVKFQNLKGEQQELHCYGLLARVILHEMDHLKGIFFVDRISPLKRQLLRGKLREIAKGRT